jgi:small GTP-binding protein
VSDQIAYILKICLLGDAGVGKTSLVYRFIENKFRENYKSTLGVNLLKKDLTFDKYGGVSAQIWDLGGQESFKSLRKLYLEGANGALIIFDTTKRKTFEKVNEWAQSFRESRGNRPLLLIGNKIDLAESQKVDQNEAKDYANKNSMNFLLTSAKTGENVEVAFKDLIKTVLDEVTHDKKDEK